MHSVYFIWGAIALAAFIVGVIFSPGITRFAVVIFSDVKKEYAKGLEEIKALYDADTKALKAEVDRVATLYDTDIAKLKSDWSAEVLKLKGDLGEANNKVSVLTSVIKGATVLTPATTAPTPIAVVATPAVAAVAPRTKAQISTDLAASQAKEAQLQAELASAVD